MSHLFPLNGPTWTLFFELAANLIYALVARRLTWRVFAVLLPVMALLVILIVPLHPIGAGWRWPDIDVGFIRVIYLFFMGVFLFRISSVVRIPAMPAWLAFVAYLAIIMMPASEQWRPYYNVATIVLFMPLLVAFASGSVVTGVAARLCGVLGILSYGVYAVHQPLSWIVQLGASHFAVRPPGFVLVAIVTVIAALLAWFGHQYYDVPVRRWLLARFALAARAPQGPERG